MVVQSQFIEMFGSCPATSPLGEVVELMDDKRKPINDSVRQGMKTGELYPYYGATGQVDLINEYLTDETLLCIAEDCGNYNAGDESSYIITGKAWVNNHAHLVRPKEGICIITYLHYYLTISDLNEYVSGTTRKKMTQGSLVRIPVTLPTIGEQHRFASFVEQADKSKFDGFKSQFIEDYFNRYEPTNLGPFISVIRGVSYKPTDIKESAEEGVTILRSNNISDGEINYDDLVYVSDLCVSQKQYLRSGDIVMCGSNGSKKLVGKAGLFTGEHGNTSFGAFCLGIRCNDNLSPEYLNAYFNSDMYRSIIEKLGNGTNIINIRPDHITSLAIPIPNIEAQKRFVSMSRQADKSKYLS